MMRRGRKPNPNAKTRQAAQLARYLLDTGIAMSGCKPPLTESAAARQAADAWRVSADNVRKYMRRMRPLEVTATTLAQNFGGLGVLPGQARRVPFIVHAAKISSPEELRRADAKTLEIRARLAAGTGTGME